MKKRVEDMAISNGSCLGYRVMGMISAISFIAGVLGLEIAMDKEGKWVMSCNIYMLVAEPLSRSLSKRWEENYVERLKTAQ